MALAFLREGCSHFLSSPHPHSVRTKCDGHCYQSHSVYFWCFAGHLCPHFYMYGQLQTNEGPSVTLLLCVVLDTKEKGGNSVMGQWHGGSIYLVNIKSYPVVNFKNLM